VGVVVEVGIAVAYSAPVEDILILRVLFGEYSVQWFSPAWPGAKDPSHAVTKSVIIARPAAAPSVLRLLVPEVPRDDVAYIGALEAVVWDTQSREEGKLADRHVVPEAARSAADDDEFVAGGVAVDPTRSLPKVLSRLCGR
jgi:hypothetical protein